VDELPQQVVETTTTQQQPQQIVQAQRLNIAGANSSAVRGTVESLGASISSTSHHHHPPSMITTMKHLLEEQGIRGFYKGVTMNWVKGPIAFSISFTTFDTIQGWIETDLEREKRSRLSEVSIQRRLTSDDD
jgi:hypothetical protein